MRPPLSLHGVRTYPLAERRSKVALGDLARPHQKGASLADFLDRLPRMLGADSLRRLVADVVRAREQGKPVLWGCGAHVIKVGLSPVLIDLMERGFVGGLALNGAGIVHDFELAVAGQTSEDVGESLGSGEFGMARETGEEINRAIREGDRDGLGLGAALGRHLTATAPPHVGISLLAAALILACIWAIRAGWARLTGRPVTPWVMRVDPREGWNRFYQSPGPWPRREPEPLARLDQSDVTDVEVKEPPRH